MPRRDISRPHTHLRRGPRSGPTPSQVLRDGGVRKGNLVAYLGLNDPAILEALFAAAHLGAVLVPLNFRLAGPELAYAINHSGAHTVLADSHHTVVIDNIRDQIAAARFVRVAAGASVLG
jgi:fatty-acyl-CoA synthase